MLTSDRYFKKYRE